MKYFWNYLLWSMCWFKSITGLFSENPLAVNLLTSPKNSWNLEKSTFIPPFLHSQLNWVTKNYFPSDLKFYDCLITRWMEIASILLVIERIYRYQFKSNYLKNERVFAWIFSAFLVTTWNFECSEKDRSLIGQVFLKLLTPKYVLI